MSSWYEYDITCCNNLLERYDSKLALLVQAEDIDGILSKGPYPPCLRMADRALLAGYPRYIPYKLEQKQVCWLRPNDPIWHQWTWSSLVQVTACCLFGTKSLPEPMLIYWWLDLWEQISLKFEWKYKTFPLVKCTERCFLKMSTILFRPWYVEMRLLSMCVQFM